MICQDLFPNKGAGLVCYNTVGALNRNWLFRVILDSRRTYSTSQIDFKLFREFFPDNLIYTIGLQKRFVILIPKWFKIEWYQMRKIELKAADVDTLGMLHTLSCMLMWLWKKWLWRWSTDSRLGSGNKE